MHPGQKINAVLHLPDSREEIERLQIKFCDFYIMQVEKQLDRYGLNKEQKLEVIGKLKDAYRADVNM